MRTRRAARLVLVLVAVLGGGAVAHGSARASTGPVAYFVGGPSGSQPLYTLDVTTGVATAVGQVTLVGRPEARPSITALALAPDGTLYAISSHTSEGDGPQLYTVDPASAVATLVAELEPAPGFAGLAFGGDGTLYVSGLDEDAFEGLMGTLDPATGQITVSATDEDTFLPGIAATCASDLYAVSKPTSFDPTQPPPGFTFVAVDEVTGEVIPIGELGTGTDSSDPQPDLVFDQATGVLWGVATSRGDDGFGGNTNEVFTVDLGSGAVDGRQITEAGEPLRFEIQNITFATPSTCAAAGPAPSTTSTTAGLAPTTPPSTGRTELVRTGPTSAGRALVAAGLLVAGAGLVVVGDRRRRG